MAKPAKYCCRCGKKMSFMDQATPVVQGNDEYVLCMDCFSKLLKIEGTDSLEEKTKLFEEYKSSVSDPDVINIFNERFESKRKEFERQSEVAAEAGRKSADQRLISGAGSNVIVSTTDNICGYNIDEYIGLVSREVIFGNEISTGISELSIPMLKTQVFTMSTGLKNKDRLRVEEQIVTSKNDVMNGIINDCHYLGGNALIGVKLEIGLVGTDIIKVSAYGTAVRISPVA